MPNPYNKKLGYEETDRLVILHADDIGMCQASVAAFEELWDFGTVSAGAVMVPAPGFQRWLRCAAETTRWTWVFMRH